MPARDWETRLLARGMRSPVLFPGAPPGSGFQFPDLCLQGAGETELFVTSLLGLRYFKYVLSFHLHNTLMQYTLLSLFREGKPIFRESGLFSQRFTSQRWQPRVSASNLPASRALLLEKVWSLGQQNQPDLGPVRNASTWVSSQTYLISLGGGVQRYFIKSPQVILRHPEDQDYVFPAILSCLFFLMF